METGLWIGGGLTVYLLGIIICSYLYGRFHRNFYTWRDDINFMIGIWPITLAIAPFIYAGIGIIKVIQWFSEFFQEIGEDHLDRQLNTERQQEVIENIEMFEDEEHTSL